MSKLVVTIDGHTYEVNLDLALQEGSTLPVNVDGRTVQVILPDPGEQIDSLEWMVIGDRPYEIHSDLDLSWIKDQAGAHPVELRDLGEEKRRPLVKDGRVKAPIPGQINQVLVDEGQVVEAGQPVVVLEAMKMFNELLAPRRGPVQAIHVSPGQNVVRGEVLVEIG